MRNRELRFSGPTWRLAECPPMPTHFRRWNRVRVFRNTGSGGPATRSRVGLHHSHRVVDRRRASYVCNGAAVASARARAWDAAAQPPGRRVPRRGTAQTFLERDTRLVVDELARLRDVELAMVGEKADASPVQRRLDAEPHAHRFAEPRRRIDRPHRHVQQRSPSTHDVGDGARDLVQRRALRRRR